MKLKYLIISLLALHINAALAKTNLQGSVVINEPVANAIVNIVDVHGNSVTTQTDSQGQYSINVDALTAPLLLSAMNQTPWNEAQGDSCIINDSPRAHCVSSVLLELQADKTNTANINPFTDYLVSNIATAMSYPGPEQLIRQGSSQGISEQTLVEPLRKFHAIFDPALSDIGVEHQSFNPINSDDHRVNNIFAVINHTRGYHNDSGEASGIVLSDMRFRPIVEGEPLDYNKAVIEKKQTLDAKTRILIVSDSTAATYERYRLPRMGWGQVFQDYFLPDSNIVVLNGARSGRASRDFYNGGWYAQMAKYMKPGDYVIIAMGHNDQNCNSQKPTRGLADVKNLCTYPNDSNGNKQYPDMHPELSFQHSLERYITMARLQGAIPIIMTPTTRVRNSKNQIPFENGSTDPVVSRHFTAPKSGYLYTGSYSDTIKKTASDNQVPLIDLEKLTIDFVNQHSNDWTSYWLAVDENDARYPYYKTQSSGTLKNPDTTHFQEQGAIAVANIVAQAIKAHPDLTPLAAQLRNEE